MNISLENLDAVCEGCLSQNRQQTAVVTDIAIKKVFYEILNVVDNIDRLTLRLCAECNANILKYLAFKKQVTEAHSTLNNYLRKSSQSITSKVSNESLSFYHTNSVVSSDSNRINSVVSTDSNRTNSVVSHSFNQVIKTDDTQLPLTFIKIEDTKDEDDYFLDDGCSQGAVDDKEFTSVLTTDLIIPNKLKIKVRSKKRTDEDFDESDDEPLGTKKTKKVPKIDRRKFPAPKKEKPAGVVNNSRVNKKLEQLNVQQGQLEMVVLSWDEVEAERQKARSSIIFTRHQYRCYDCVLGFNHKFKLTNHMKKHDQSAGELLCEVCKVRCKDTHSLGAHRRRHRVRWRCTLCGCLSSRAGVAADHVARQHAGTTPTHTCRVCGDTQPSLAKLRNHMKNHAERQKCELCGKSFRDRSSLRTHLFIHKGEKEYACPRCDKRFLFKKAMEVHLVTHDASQHLYCIQCDLNFKNRMSYQQHVKYSLKHIDPEQLKYACDECDKRFMKSSRLLEHRLAVHLKLTPVHCTMPGCDFSCASRPVLRTHTRMQHRGGRSVRNHVCHTCGKTYMTKKSLEGHLRSHTGERPFKCSLCPSAFGYEAALYNHNKLVHLKAKLGRSRPPQLPTTSTALPP